MYLSSELLVFFCVSLFLISYVTWSASFDMVLELGGGWVPWEQGAASRKKKDKKPKQNKNPSAVYSLQFNVWPHSPESLSFGSLVLNMLPKTTEAFFSPLKHTFRLVHPHSQASLRSLLSRCSPYAWSCKFQKWLFHHSFQVVCPVPRYPLWLFFPALVLRTDQCSRKSRPQCSLYRYFRSLIIACLLPSGTIWVQCSFSLWNIHIAWNWPSFWPNLGNSDFHGIVPSMFQLPWCRSQSSSSFLTSWFIAFHRTQNKELVFILGWCVKSFHCIQHVLNSEPVLVQGATLHCRCFGQVAAQNCRKLQESCSVRIRIRHNLSKSPLI